MFEQEEICLKIQKMNKSKIAFGLFALVLLLVGILLFLFIGAGTEKWETTTAPPPPARDHPLELRLIGRQFYWTVWYPGRDGKFGKLREVSIDSVNILGLSKNNPFAQDDLVVRDLFYLPVNREIRWTMRSLGVVHGAYFPHFRAAQKVLPGMDSQLHFTVKSTTQAMRADTSRPNAATFDYLLACNEICGRGHYDMNMIVKVVENAAYQEWLNKQTTVGETLEW